MFARGGAAFETKCSAGTTEACYWLAKLHTHNVGGYKDVLEEVLPLYEKACAGGRPEGCTSAAQFRDERDKRAQLHSGPAPRLR